MPPIIRLLRALVPPQWARLSREAKRRFVPSSAEFAHAPLGWSTHLPGHAMHADYWAAFIDQERRWYAEVESRAERGETELCPDPAEAVKYRAFSDVVHGMSPDGAPLKILDYGANLGEYLWVARAALPRHTIEYHCVELPPLVAVGAEVNRGVTWHTGEACLDETYDLVMFSSCIQYLPSWRESIQRGCRAARQLLFVADVPVVRDAASYVVTQRNAGVATLQYVLNRNELVTCVEQCGMRLRKEMLLRAHPFIAGAPEQPFCLSFVFAPA